MTPGPKPSHLRRLLHLAGILLMLGTAWAAMAALLEARSVVTDLALALRGLAFTLCSLGPVVAYGLLLATGRQPSAPLSPGRLAWRYAAAGLLLAVPYVLASHAFPGPWLAGD